MGLFVGRMDPQVPWVHLVSTKVQNLVHSNLVTMASLVPGLRAVCNQVPFYGHLITTAKCRCNQVTTAQCRCSKVCPKLEALCRAINTSEVHIARDSRHSLWGVENIVTLYPRLFPLFP